MQIQADKLKSAFLWQKQACNSFFVLFIFIHFLCLEFWQLEASILGGRQLGQVKFFVNIECDDRHMSQLSEKMIQDALLRSPGFSVLDSETVRKIKEDALMMARLNADDPSALLEIEDKYSVDYHIRGSLKVASNLLAGQFQASASLVLSVIDTKTAEVIFPTSSPAIGSPDNPSPIKSLELTAMQSAVALAANSVIGSLQLPGGFDPDNVVTLEFKSQAKEWMIGEEVASIALDGLGHCFAGTSKTIYKYSMLDSSIESTWGSSEPVSFLLTTSDNRFLISGHSDGSVKKRDSATGVIEWDKKVLTRPVRAIDYSSKGQMIAVGDSDGNVGLVREDGQTILVWAAHRGGKNNAIRSLSFAYDGASLFSAGEDRKICKWDIDNQKKLIYSLPVKTGIESSRVLGRLYDAAFARQGNAVVVAFEDITLPKFSKYRIDQNYLILYSLKPDRPDPTPRFRDEQYRKDIQTLALCPTTCRLLASGADDGSVVMTDLQSKRVLFESTLEGAVRQVVFSPEANWFAAAAVKSSFLQKNSTVYIWKTN